MHSEPGYVELGRMDCVVVHDFSELLAPGEGWSNAPSLG